jgi:O-antigen biosynthesis protein WbqP
MLLTMVFTLIIIPFLLFIAFIIFFVDGLPVFFKQDRVGKNNKIFKMYKFRTMVNNVGNIPKSKIKNPKEFITITGHFLRKYSLDELPQLLNIFNGSMKLIGYRPCLPNELDVLKERHDFSLSNYKPGITGWAQVNGRDSLTVESKVYYDAFYYENHSIYLDIKIIIRTILLVILKKDVSH